MKHPGIMTASNKSPKAFHHRKYPFFLSPYLLLIPIFFFFFVIAFFHKKSWANKVVLSAFVATGLYFFFISATYTFRAYLSKRGTSLFRMAGLLSSLNALISTVGIYLIAISPNFATFLIGLGCFSYAFISPYLYAFFFKIKSDDATYLFSSVGLTMDTWLVLSGKTIVKKGNQLNPVDRFLGNDLPEIAKNLRKNINTGAIEKNAWKDSIRFFLYLIFYLFITAPIYIPFTILLIFNGFFIPILMPIGLFLGQIYIISAFIASIIAVEIRKKPIHNQIIGEFASKEDAYLLAIFVLLSIRTTWLLALVASLAYPSILVVNNYVLQLDPVLLTIAQLITGLVPLLVILNILNFTKFLLKTLENPSETYVNNT